jgi:uncharacterized protein
MSGEVAHFELPADNTERASRFYATVFGWKPTRVPGMDYAMVTTGPVDEHGIPKERGSIGGGIGKRQDYLDHTVVNIIVDEISDAETRIEKAGGRILQRKKPIGDGSMGFSGYFKDTEGNIVGLYQAPKS